jgi:hypothetical protein
VLLSFAQFEREVTGGGSFVSDIDACRVSAFSTVLMWHLMGSAGCRAARLKSQSAKLTACYRIGAVICSLPRASLRSGARFDLLSS